ncbi:MAG: peptide chain release factor N(5)-glutamine methyltransferase [Candidatus Aminicenantaceae bacterium]
MASIQELFQKGESILGEFPDSALEAKLLLLSAASIDEEQFFSSPKQKLSKEKQRNYFQLITKRLTGIPLAYITGSKEFWSIAFKILPGVIIPRPETELIVEKVLEYSSRKKETIVDIGTGCGNIAVSLAKELPQAHIVATDVSRKALKVARLNASHQKVNNVTFIRGSLLSPLQKLNLYNECDFIVSNPPYVSKEEWAKLPPEIKNHEPKKALVAGETGLEVIEKIIQDSRPFLKPAGRLVLEIGESQKEKVESLFGPGWKNVTFYNDLSRIPRVAVGERA